MSALTLNVYFFFYREQQRIIMTITIMFIITQSAQAIRNIYSQYLYFFNKMTCQKKEYLTHYLITGNLFNLVNDEKLSYQLCALVHIQHNS